MSKYKFPISPTQSEATPSDKKEEIVNVVTATVEPLKESELPRFLIGTFVCPDTQEWMLGYAKFDPKTNTFGKLQKERVAGDGDVLRERFQIKVINLGMFERDNVTEENAINIY